MGLNGLEPTDELLAGRRALDGLREVSILEDWRWYEGAGAWVLHLRLTAEVGDDSDIPRETDWYVTVDPAYPWGRLRFYPAVEGGITSTYHHQMSNLPVSDGLPWRSGWLCLKRPSADSFAVPAARGEEPTEAHRRLEWHCLRALEWLRLASVGQLVRDGEPFELPHFPTECDSRLAFIEDESSFSAWSSVNHQVGMCSIRALPGNKRVVTADHFATIDGETLLTGRWRSGPGKKLGSGAWLRLSDVPVVRNWEAPRVWSDLLGIDPAFSELLSRGAAGIRDRQRHFLLVGFPIPNRVGEDASRMHWQAALLPRLTDEPGKGFSRSTEESFWLCDKARVLRGPVEWIRSQNWAEDQLSTRGTLPDKVKDKTVLLLGCGALGAPLAEMLVRGGVKEMVLVDGDAVDAGNLVRHTLTSHDVGSNKAVALAERLNAANVHAEVTPIPTAFPPSDDEARECIEGCDLVIDCTASDDVLRFMETYPWGRERHFISLSMGYSARRLFCFADSGCSFPRAAFLEQFGPHWQREREEHPLEELPWEGIGCWHPIFPGRIDDVWLLAAAAVKFIEGAIDGTHPAGAVAVFEQGDAEAKLSRVMTEHVGTSDAAE